MRVGIYRSTSKGDNEEDADSWDEHDFDVEGGGKVVNDERDKNSNKQLRCD